MMSTGPDLVEPRIMAEDLARIRRRLVNRRRRLIAAVVVAILLAGGLAWKVHRHLFAAGWLVMSAMQVDWQIDRATWRQGGVTAVRALAPRSLREDRYRDVLDSLAGLHRVESLHLANIAELEDSDLEILPALADLETLNLDQAREQFQPRLDSRGLTDATLARIRGLRRLRELSLIRTRITDAGLANLAGLADLESLDLSRTRITDAGLEHLKGLKRLRWLTLTGTNVTDRGVRAIEAALPDLTVSADPPSSR